MYIYKCCLLFGYVRGNAFDKTWPKPLPTKFKGAPISGQGWVFVHCSRFNGLWDGSEKLFNVKLFNEYVFELENISDNWI